MKRIFLFLMGLTLALPSSVWAKRIFIEIVNNTVSNCFCIDGFQSNGYMWELPLRIPRGSSDKFSLVHNIFSKQPKVELIYMCGAKTVTFGAEDTTELGFDLTVQAYFIRADDGLTATVEPLNDRSNKNKPLLARVTLSNN